ncbi:MAG: DUF7146 domain-containing protein [Steroidobacteraceae bacterium]
MMETVSLSLRCRGRWPEIIAQLAPYEELLDAIKRGHRKHGWCPVHRGENGDAFRIFPNFTELGGAVCNSCGMFGTGFKLLMWVNGWNVERTGQELKRFLDGEAIPRSLSRPQAPVGSTPKETAYRRPTRERLRHLWEEAKPLTHEQAAPVRSYFASRGLGALDLDALQALRCHPGLAYWNKDRVYVGHFPVLLSYVVDPAGALVALHRIYLTREGSKAPVDRPKKLLVAENATASGGAVRIHPAGAIVCNSEGLENGLTSLLKNRLPLWVATSAPLLAAMVLPPQVRHTVTLADYEPEQRQPDGSVRQPGRDAAEKLAARLRAEGRTAEILMPKPQRPDQKLDWNKVLLDHGIDAIPTLSTRIRMLPTAYRLEQLNHGTVIRG